MRKIGYSINWDFDCEYYNYEEVPCVYSDESDDEGHKKWKKRYSEMDSQRKTLYQQAAIFIHKYTESLKIGV